MPRNEVEDQIRSCGGGGHQASTGVRSEHRLQVVGVVLDPWNDLTAIEARGALADFRSLEHDHLAPGLGQVQRCRESGVAAADDDSLGAVRALSTLHTGPAGAATDHSDCSGTDIAISIIDSLLS